MFSWLNKKMSILFGCLFIESLDSVECRGWSGGTEVSCSLRHWGVQLILAYSWARPAILVAGKGRRVVWPQTLSLFFFSFSFFEGTQHLYSL